jgi:hypothetical protein
MTPVSTDCTAQETSTCTIKVIETETSKKSYLKNSSIFLLILFLSAGHVLFLNDGVSPCFGTASVPNNGV